MSNLTNTAHLIALPFVAATVMHTHGGLGYESPALGWAVASGLAAAVWIGWGHVFAPRAGWLVRVLAITACLILAPLEGYLMYQHQGDIKDPAYTSELATYQQAQADHAAMVKSWEQDTANRADLRKVIKKQIQEIVDTDKMTSRRGDFERLQKDLAKLDASATTPPAFTVAPPVERTAINEPWLFKTAITVGVIPVIYMLLHLFGFYRVTEKSYTKDTEELQSYMLPICNPSVTNQETLIYDDKKRLQKDIAIDVKKIMQLPVNANFNCPVCGKESIKTRAATKTCGGNACKVSVHRAMTNIKPVKQKSAAILSIVK